MKIKTNYVVAKTKNNELFNSSSRINTLKELKRVIRINETNATPFKLSSLVKKMREANILPKSFYKKLKDIYFEKEEYMFLKINFKKNKQTLTTMETKSKEMFIELENEVFNELINHER